MVIFFWLRYIYTGEISCHITCLENRPVCIYHISSLMSKEALLGLSVGCVEGCLLRDPLRSADRFGMIEYFRP